MNFLFFIQILLLLLLVLASVGIIFLIVKVFGLVRKIERKVNVIDTDTKNHDDN